tara:strand:- start:45 stop:926 length:882 start_codon:yes stop_codon:yes gene_type:complete
MSNKPIVVTGFAVLAASAGLLLANSHATSQAEEALSELKTEAQAMGVEMSYSDVSANIFGDVSVSDAKFSVPFAGAEVLVDHVEAEGLGGDPDELSDIKLSLKGISLKDGGNLKVDKTPDDIQEMVIYAMVKEGKKVDLNLEVDGDSETGEFELEDLSLAGEDLGKIALSGDFASKSFASGNLDVNAPMKMGAFSLTLSDDGIVDRLLMAQNRTKDVDEAREKIIEKGERALEKAEGFEKEMIEGILALIDGDDITLTRDNDTPLEINPLALMGNQRALKKFGRDGEFTVIIH